MFALAERSGFNSNSSFHSVFKELTGMTPNEYKRLL
ncbi:MAG: AraC family transcriptional regulator [Schleiferiaceae bacterium]